MSTDDKNRRLAEARGQCREHTWEPQHWADIDLGDDIPCSVEQPRKCLHCEAQLYPTGLVDEPLYLPYDEDLNAVRNVVLGLDSHKLAWYRKHLVDTAAKRMTCTEHAAAESAIDATAAQRVDALIATLEGKA